MANRSTQLARMAVNLLNVITAGAVLSGSGWYFAHAMGPTGGGTTQRSAPPERRKRASAVAMGPVTSSPAPRPDVWRVERWVPYRDADERFTCRQPDGWDTRHDNSGLYWRTSFVSPHRHTLQVKVRKQGIPGSSERELADSEQRLLSAPLTASGVERVLYDRPAEFHGKKARSYGAWTTVEKEPATQLVFQFVCGGVPYLLSLTAARQNTADLQPAEDLLQEFVNQFETVHCKPSGIQGRFADSHGFFTVVPPDGWLARTYPDDPRGKVSFRHPTSGAEVRILAKASEVEPNNLEAIAANLRGHLRQLRINGRVETTKLPCGEAVKARYSFKGEEFLTIALPVEDMYHDLMYAASPSAFDASLPVAMKCVESYRPVSRTLDDAATGEQLVQSLRKQAEALRALGDPARALRRVEEGLKLAPDDPALLKLREELKNGR